VNYVTLLPGITTHTTRADKFGHSFQLFGFMQQNTKI